MAHPGTAGSLHGRLILVIGGASSGKSVKALELAGEASPRIFVATGQPFDEEMTERIRRHKTSRGVNWTTEEVPVDLAKWFDSNRGRYRTVLLDCLTLWMSNLLGSGIPDAEVSNHVGTLLRAIRSARSRVVVVSNEVGMGIVPFNAETRRFRDLAGQANQQIAEQADEVHLVISGISVRLK